MINKILYSIKKTLLARLKNRFAYYDFIQNINRSFLQEQQSVLIIYVTSPLRTGKNEASHSNTQEANEIIKYFIDKGFAIDVLGVTEINYQKLLQDKHYDVIFGLGPAFTYACNKYPNAVKIFYLTENNPEVARRNYDIRYRDYINRHRFKPNDIKRLSLIDENQFKYADYGILLNNKYNAAHSRKFFKKSFLLNPSGMINPSFHWQTKDFSKIRHNFVWFGSSGVIHKGLDVTVEAFNFLGKEWKLKMCGVYESEKCVLRIKNKSVTYSGFINVTSQKFLELINDSTFVILPSCSEGVSTGIITCMLHGLIPIITRETGIDLPERTGFYIDDFAPAAIAKLINNLKSLTNEELKELSMNAFKYSSEVFSLQSFTRNFNHAMDNILYTVNGA